jgi:hypothetical protein
MGGNMSTAHRIGDVEPLPRYLMPDASVPDYEAILKQLRDYQCSFIGSSYYYIRVDNDRRSLCRIIPAAGRLYFHEIVNHNKHGISDEELKEAISLDPGSFSTPDYHPISPHIEMKLREQAEGQ